MGCLASRAGGSQEHRELDAQRAAESIVARLDGPGIVFFVNRWRVQDGERRAGRMLGFGGNSVKLEATWSQPGGGKVPWELLPADEWNPNTGQRVERGTWNPLRGNQGVSWRIRTPRWQAVLHRQSLEDGGWRTSRGTHAGLQWRQCHS